jgi:hypothetical protein
MAQAHVCKLKTFTCALKKHKCVDKLSFGCNKFYNVLWKFYVNKFGVKLIHKIELNLDLIVHDNNLKITIT